VSRDTNFYAVGRHLLLRTPGSGSGRRFATVRAGAPVSRGARRRRLQRASPDAPPALR